jgi:hypothetical protein
MDGVVEEWGGVRVALDFDPFSCLKWNFGAGPAMGSLSSLSLTIRTEVGGGLDFAEAEQ